MIYLQLFWSYLKIGFCSFGGLSMIPFINQEMLFHHWMTMEQLSDIVAIAEMTPGSLGINCATFVGIQIAGLPGALATTLGVMTPSLTVCMLACHFMVKFKENRYLQNALYGVRPVCIGMILAIIPSMAGTNYLANGAPLWPALAIGAVGGGLLLAKRSIPTVILTGALLGLALIR